MVDWLMEQLVGWITAGLTASLDALLSVMGGTLLLLPDVTLAEQVRMLNGQMVGIVNVCYVIAIVAGFAIAMTHETVQAQYAVKDIAPRLAFGAVAANALMNLHHVVHYGHNSHHIAEGIFKSTARALRIAVAIDPRQTGVPSSKGTLSE